jgi:hypothetical protein
LFFYRKQAEINSRELRKNPRKKQPKTLLKGLSKGFLKKLKKTRRQFENGIGMNLEQSFEEEVIYIIRTFLNNDEKK